MGSNNYNALIIADECVEASSIAFMINSTFDSDIIALSAIKDINKYDIIIYCPTLSNSILDELSMEELKRWQLKHNNMPICMIISRSDINYFFLNKKFNFSTINIGCVPATLVAQLILLIEAYKEINVQLSTKLEDAIRLCNITIGEIDSYTKQHLSNVYKYVKCFLECMELYASKEYKNRLTEEFKRSLMVSSTIHDIGKLGIDKSIWLKPDKLTEAEFNMIKKHTTYGWIYLSHICDGNTVPFVVDIARNVTLTHHERWDGTGYPIGIRGNSIPLCGRIMSIIDVYDAITSKRIYKDGLSHSDAISIMTDSKGQFDPYLLGLFTENEKQIEKINLEIVHSDII